MMLSVLICNQQALKFTQAINEITYSSLRRFVLRLNAKADAVHSGTIDAAMRVLSSVYFSLI
jgi:hypothetical protein